MKAARRQAERWNPIEDEAVRNALELYDNRLSFEDIAKVMGRTKTWARDVITGALLELGADAPLH